VNGRSRGSGRTCPSAPGSQPGARLIAIRGAKSEVTYLGIPTVVTERESAPSGSGQVLRFASPCAEGDCLHWQDSACQLAKRIAGVVQEVNAELPACGIRATCRWFLQEGRRACSACPTVLTDANADQMVDAVASSPAGAAPIARVRIVSLPVIPTRQV
jgi:hypothetical protein